MSTRPEASTSFGGHTFSIFTQLAFRYTAKNLASEQLWNKQKGRIVRLPCPELEAHLSKWLSTLNLGEKVDFWLDVEERSGKWKDSEGKELTYFNWAEGEPNNSRKSDHCAVAKLFNEGQDLKWTDASCPVAKAYVIVEFGEEELDCSNSHAEL